MKRSEMTFDDAIEQFTQGVWDYTGGVVPDGWDKPDANQNPYLAGWNIAADMENTQNYFAGDDDEDEEDEE